jgi:hypothetical protein
MSDNLGSHSVSIRSNAIPTREKSYSNLNDLAANPPARGAFGLALMEAVGAPHSTITELRDTAKDGEFAWARMLRFKATEPGGRMLRWTGMRAEAEASAKGAVPECCSPSRVNGSPPSTRARGSTRSRCVSTWVEPYAVVIGYQGFDDSGVSLSFRRRGCCGDKRERIRRISVIRATMAP